MALNISKGNMYNFVTHTWNTIKGRCLHDCSYCYMKRFPQNKVRLDRKELSIILGRKNFIFVGSSCDMFASDIPDDWIKETLTHCNNYPNNKYLFQSKNLRRISHYKELLPKNSVIATTIETNRVYKQMGKHTPSPTIRAMYINAFRREGFKTMITIEPIMDFDLDILVKIIKLANPDWVNIGADSGYNNLPEPSKEKINLFIEQLKLIDIKVINKNNIDRLIK